MSTTTPQKPAFQMPPFSAEHQATQKVATRLVEMISAGKNRDAFKELYAGDARHVEVMDGPGCARVTTGVDNLLKNAQKMYENTEIHGASCGKAIVNGDQFILPMSLDCTSKEGPMAGHRMNMTETALYTVKNGKIAEGKFFYSFGC